MATIKQPKVQLTWPNGARFSGEIVRLSVFDFDGFAKEGAVVEVLTGDAISIVRYAGELIDIGKHQWAMCLLLVYPNTRHRNAVTDAAIKSLWARVDNSKPVDAHLIARTAVA